MKKTMCLRPDKGAWTRMRIMAGLFAAFAMAQTFGGDNLAEYEAALNHADEAARFALHGRPAPKIAAQKSEVNYAKMGKAKLFSSSGSAYPASIGGNKSYEYISSFTVTPKDGYYKITVKVICPKLYDAEGYPGYGSTLEYVNVWIDWNGDYSWSDSERVMAKSSANYKKILADNKILYFETTVKDASTAGGTFKARAMLGYGYNPTSPGTYSWTWGDVMDVGVTFGFDPPTVAAVAIGPFADAAAIQTSSITKPSSSAWLGADSGVNNKVKAGNAVIVGMQNYISVGIKVKKSDREKPGFNYKALIFIEETILGPYELSNSPYDVRMENGVEYGYYYLNGTVNFPYDGIIGYPTDPGTYGEKKLTVQLDCTDPNVDVCGVPQPYTYYVFYQKDYPVSHTFRTFHEQSLFDGELYETYKSTSVPMWYEMWSRFVDDLDKFEFDNNIGGAEGKTFSKYESLPTTGKENDETTISWKPPVYKISRGAAFIYERDGSGFRTRGHADLKPGITEDRLDYPIDYVVQTVEHEKWHYKLHKDNTKAVLKRGLNALYWTIVGDGEGSIKLDSSGEYKWQKGDLLVDYREKEIGTDESLRDTFDLEHKIDSEYKTYGDQELYCRLMTQKGKIASMKGYYTEDWSYPGAQLTEWQLNPKPNLKSMKSVTLKSNTSTAQAKETRSSDLLSASMGSVIMSDNDEFLFADTPDVAFLSFVDVTDDFNSQGLIVESSLNHTLAGDWSFVAYLFGTNGVALASAVTTESFFPGKEKVQFEFSPDTLAKVREFYSGPYVLGRVICEVPHNAMANVYSAKNVLTTKDYSAYECKVTKPIVGSKMSDYADGEGLHVVMPVTVPSAGEYAISAYLATTNGMNLVNVTTNCVCVEGKNSINVSFPKDGVFNTKMSGCFLVRDVSVTPEGGEPSLFVCDYETKSYNYSDFDSGEKAIVILPNTIELSVSKDTEDPNALHKGIAMRFTAKNKSSSDYTLYRASAILVDANGYNVAYANEDFIFNGESSNVLFFPAQDIRKSEKKGPYFIKSLRITDRFTGELIDGCMVSAAKTTALASTDFRGDMVIDENAIAVTPVAASYDKSKYGGFHLIVPIDSPSSGYATLSAIVESEGGASVGRFEDEIEVGSGANKLTLNLNGAKFLESKVNGPYIIRAIAVSHSSNPDVVVEADKVLQTKKYTYTQFVDEDTEPSDANGGADDGGGSGGSVLPTPAPTPEPEPEPESEPAPAAAAMTLFDAVEGVVATNAASVYDGFLRDADGAIAGTVQVKVSKPDRRTGLSTVTATVQPAGGKKKTLKAAAKGKAALAADGPTAVSFSGGEVCEALLGAGAMSGAYGEYSLEGARNAFSSKSKEEKAAAETSLAPWLGAVNVKFDGGTASVAIQKKGKARATVTLASGAKETVVAQVLAGDGVYCIPVVAQKKAKKSFALWLQTDGTVAVEGLGDGAVAAKAVVPPEELVFAISGGAEAWTAAGLPGEAALLPDGFAFSGGAKWKFPKADTVKLVDGVASVTKANGNPSGLKLTYKASDGTFKGTFKAYCVEKGRLRSKTVNISGIMVGEEGFGAAEIKKTGSIGISISRPPQ